MAKKVRPMCCGSVIAGILQLKGERVRAARVISAQERRLRHLPIEIRSPSSSTRQRTLPTCPSNSPAAPEDDPILMGKACHVPPPWIVLPSEREERS